MEMLSINSDGLNSKGEKVKTYKAKAAAGAMKFVTGMMEITNNIRESSNNIMGIPLLSAKYYSRLFTCMVK